MTETRNNQTRDAGEPWVPIPRSLMASAAWQRPELRDLLLWLYAEANWRPGTWSVPGLPAIDVPRGSLVIGQRTLWERAYGSRSKPTARTCWNWVGNLRELGLIRVKNLSNRASLITCVHYMSFDKSDSGDFPTGFQPISNKVPTDFHNPKKGRSNNKKPSSPPSASMPDPEDWGEVREALRSCGIIAVDSAIAGARKNGAQPADVLGLVKHFASKPGAWEAGLLQFRVRTCLAGLDGTLGWPAESEAWRRENERAKRRAALLSPIEPAQKPTVHEPDLESVHGAALDALDAERLDDLAARLGSFEREFFVRHRATARAVPSVRSSLLRLLARDAGDVPAAERIVLATTSDGTRRRGVALTGAGINGSGDLR